MDLLGSTFELSPAEAAKWAWRHYEAYRLTGKQYRLNDAVKILQGVIFTRLRSAQAFGGGFRGEEHRFEAGEEALVSLWKGLRGRKVIFRDSDHMMAWAFWLANRRVGGTFKERSMSPIPNGYVPPRCTAPNPMVQAMTREFLSTFKSRVIESAVETSRFPDYCDDLIRHVAESLIDKKPLRKSVLQSRYGLSNDSYASLVEYVGVRIRIMMRRLLRENQDLLDLSLSSERVPDKRLAHQSFDEGGTFIYGADQ